MKKLLTAITAALTITASGFAGIGYDAEDAKNDRRQDLIGYIFNLKEKPDQSYQEYGYIEHREAVKRVEALKDR